MTSCSICCENFNKSSREQIICPNKDCILEVCKICVRTYLINVKDPSCMNCKIPFDQNYLVMNLNRTFVEKDLKLHRKQLLTEREMARMPETMEAAERYKSIQLINEENKELILKINLIKKELRELENKKGENNLIIYNLNRGSPNNQDQSQKRQFIMACPDPNCRGYLSTAYKCEICRLYTCPHCLEIIGHEKNNHNHICNEDSVKTADIIKSTTKPCPGCGERIIKIDGCDQMWCTQCHVAFSWKTGIIDTGVVHNPHFYQHQRQGGNINLRNPGEVLCGGMPNFWTMRNNFTRKMRLPRESVEEYNSMKKFMDYLSDLHRIFNHIQYHELNQARQNMQQTNNLENIRVRYLIGEISKDQLSIEVFKKDKQYKKYTELVHIYELIHVVSVDLFRWIENYFNNIESKTYNTNIIISQVSEKINELNNLRIYINEQLSKISISYNQKVPQFTEKWEINSEKFSLAKATSKKNIKIGNNDFTNNNIVPDMGSSSNDQSNLIDSDWEEGLDLLP